MRLLLLAPPGAGKGTQGERLAAWSGARHIAAGDLLRAEASAGSLLGREIAAYQARGDLVPDRIAFGVLLFARPGVGVLTLALLFGLYALIYGFSQITAGIQLRQLGGHAESRTELHNVA